MPNAKYVCLRSEDGRLWGNACGAPWERGSAELFARQFPANHLAVELHDSIPPLQAAPVGPVHRGTHIDSSEVDE